MSPVCILIVFFLFPVYPWLFFLSPVYPWRNLFVPRVFLAYYFPTLNIVNLWQFWQLDYCLLFYDNFVTKVFITWFLYHIFIHPQLKRVPRQCLIEKISLFRISPSTVIKLVNVLVLLFWEGKSCWFDFSVIRRSKSHLGTSSENIARGTTDPGIASITWIISPATK